MKSFLEYFWAVILTLLLGYMGIRAWTILPPMLALAVDFIYVALLVHYYSVRIELAALRRTHKPGG